MSLIIATGSNLDFPIDNLAKAKKLLSEKFELIAQSRIFHSPPFEYENQPYFYNQVLEFTLPEAEAPEVMDHLLDIELRMGRVRDIPKGPRVIDIDLLFWGLESFTFSNVTVPHPRLFQRSFVVLPLKELPFYETLSQNFSFSKTFNVMAWPIP